MDEKKFIREIEKHLKPLAPEMIPGLIKKQLENVTVAGRKMTPADAKKFIERVSEALILFVGPKGAESAKKRMLKTLRESCTEDEIMKLLHSK